MSITIYRHDGGPGGREMLDEPVPTDATHVSIYTDGNGGVTHEAYLEGEELPEADYPQRPEPDGEGYYGGRGWAGSPWGTQLLTVDAYLELYPERRAGGEASGRRRAMTRRERMERRAERRREWASGRKRKAEEAHGRADRVAGRIPLGQPVLVGHHSEGRARRDMERIQQATRRGFEHQEMAEHHETKARGIEQQLKTSIYSDDEDAVEALEARIADRKAERERRKKANAAWRRAGKPSLNSEDAEVWAELRAKLGDDLVEEAMAGLQYQSRQHGDRWVLLSYAKPFNLTNIGASIRRDEKRLAELRGNE